MRPSRTWLGCTSIAASVACAGCLGDDTNPPLPPAADASLPADASVDATLASEASVDAEPPTLQVASVRVANWSPDSPAVDVCLAKHGTGAFAAPLLAQEAAALDAGGATLAYPGVSAYFFVPPGQYDVRVIVAGASDCAVGVAPDMTTLSPLAVGDFATLALLGWAHGPSGAAATLKVTGFRDDGLAQAKVTLRFINADSTAAVDFGSGAGATFSPIFKGVALGAAGQIADAGVVDGGLTADARGYVVLPALVAQTLSARPSGATRDLVVATGVNVSAGAIVTAALVDVPGGAPDGGAAYELLECVDNAGTVGVSAVCVPLSL